MTEHLADELEGVARDVLLFKVHLEDGTPGILMEMPLKGNENLETGRLTGIMDRLSFKMEIESLAENLYGSPPAKGSIISLNFTGASKPGSVAAFIRSGPRSSVFLQKMSSASSTYYLFIKDSDKRDMLEFLNRHPDSVDKYYDTLFAYYELFKKRNR
jgi:hypothetical protein